MSIHVENQVSGGLLRLPYPEYDHMVICTDDINV